MKMRTVFPVPSHESRPEPEEIRSNNTPARWSGLYRNRAIVLALGLSLGSILLLSLAGGDRISMLACGIIAASFLYVLNGTRYSRLFNDLLILGAVNELTWSRMSILRDLLLYGALFVAGFVALTVLGIIPGGEMVTSLAFYAGFGINGWYHLVMVSAWERRNGQRISTDGTMLWLADEKPVMEQPCH
jgi:hypothetical protein